MVATFYMHQSIVTFVGDINLPGSTVTIWVNNPIIAGNICHVFTRKG